MKKNILITIISIFFLLTIMANFVNAELYLWNNVIIDYDNNITRYHAYYQFEDTSERKIGRNKDIDVSFTYVVEALPYNVSGGQVDWCNFTINAFHNEYNEEGYLLNTSTETQNVYFGTGGLSTDTITISVRDADDIIADMDCHYTNSSTLYQEHALIGKFDTFLPSFECKGCGDYTLEELSGEIERSDEITENEITIYSVFNIIVGLNYQLWTILSWIVKIFFLVFAVGLIFSSVYFLYKFFEDILRRI